MSHFHPYGQPSPERHFVPQEVPELWRKYALQPWRVIFPDLDWPLPPYFQEEL